MSTRSQRASGGCGATTASLRAALALSTAALAACVGERPEPAPVVYRTTPAPETAPSPRRAPQPSAVAPSTSPSPTPSGQADSRGVVFYEGYESVRARPGDTVEDMAARAGVSGTELAAYNGLSTRYVPSEGDELVLPPSADRRQTAPEPVRTASAPPPTYTPSATAQTTADAGTSESDPGWSSARAREAIGDGPADASPAGSTVTDAPLPPPDVATTSEPDPEPATETASVSETPAPSEASVSSARSGQFLRPTNASVARPFSRAPGEGRNDGVDFQTQPGDPVKAADDGAVALISESLGGLGTIVLIRHENEYLTVYGRIDDVTVAKGDRVTRGQTFARVADVAPPRDPYLHFEVRRGAESVDPQPFF